MSATNANTIANDLFPKTVLKQASLWENATKETILSCIQLLALHYSFDIDEATRHIQLDEMKIVYKKSAKAPREKKEKIVKEKVVKEKVVKEKKTLIPLPFLKHCVSTTACQGLNFNRGLFTQCEKSPLENGKYCSKCQSEAAQSSNNVPKCGSVVERLNADLYDFVDPSGRKPTHFLKVIQKMKISVEQVEAHMDTQNLTFDESHICHIIEPEQPAKKKGGKKASTAVAEAEVVDMFAQLQLSASLNTPVAVDDDSIMPQIISEKEAKKAKKEAKKAEKEAKKEAKKQVVDKEALKQVVDKEALKAENEAKKAAEKKALKAEKEAKKAAEKEAKKAEKDALKAEKAEKKSKKNKKEVVAVAVDVAVDVAEELKEEVIVEEAELIADLDELDLDELEDESDDDDAEADAEDFEYNGTTYLVEKTCINDETFEVYDKSTSEKVGVYSTLTGVLTLDDDDEY